MATFQAWFQTGEYGKVWFEADSYEEAEALLDRATTGEITMEDLPNATVKIKGDQFEYGDLEEMED